MLNVLNILKFAILNLLIVLAVLAGIVAQAAEGDDGSKGDTLATHQVSDAGSNSGGGGNLEKPQPASPESVASFVAKIGQLTSFFYNSFEPRGENTSVGGVPADFSSSIPEKLYRGKITIYDVIKNTTIIVKTDKPCVDPNGQLADASAVVYEPYSYEICFSVKRLAPQLWEHDYRKRLLALAAHEYSHLLNATEPEAQAIETFINRTVIYDPSTERLLSGMFYDINFHARNMIRDFSDFAKKLKSNNVSDAGACIAVLMYGPAAMGRIEEIYRRTWGLNLSMFNRAEESAYWTAWEKIMNAETICSSVPLTRDFSRAPPIQIIKGGLFSDGERVIPMATYVERTRSSVKDNVMKSAVVRRVDDGDRNALALEVLDIANLMQLAFPQTGK